LLAADFGGHPINAQNLSNWRQGGYQRWVQHQERVQLARDLFVDAQELCREAGDAELSKPLASLLMAEFATSALDTLATVADPAERSAKIMSYFATLTRLRHQDYLAERLAFQRECQKPQPGNQKPNSRSGQDRTAKPSIGPGKNPSSPKPCPDLDVLPTLITTLPIPSDVMHGASPNPEIESIVRDLKLPLADPPISLHRRESSHIKVNQA
jgi:hypothetical protein